MNKIFEPRDPLRVADLKEVNLEQLLPEIYTATTIYVDKQDAEGKVTTNSFNLLPRGVNSLKVLQVGFCFVISFKRLKLILNL